MAVLLVVHIHRSVQLQQLVHSHFAGDWQHYRLFGLAALHRRRWVAMSAAAAPGAALPDRDWRLFSPALPGVFLRRPPLCSFSGCLPCMQCSNCLPPSSHTAKMARVLSGTVVLPPLGQSLIWPGSTGVQRVMPGIIRSLVIVVSLVLLEACKYPEVCAVPPFSGTSYE